MSNDNTEYKKLFEIIFSNSKLQEALGILGIWCIDYNND